MRNHLLDWMLFPFWVVATVVLVIVWIVAAIVGSFFENHDDDTETSFR